MLKIALGQIEIHPGQPKTNASTMLNMIEQAKIAEVDLLIFPEMAISGSMLGDTSKNTDFLTDCAKWGEKIDAASKGIAIIYGNITSNITPAKEAVQHIICAAAQNGKRVQKPNTNLSYQIKSLLYQSLAFKEEGYYFCNNTTWANQIGANPADLLAPIQLTLGGKTYNIGLLVCADAGGRIADTILSKWPVDFFVNISSSFWEIGKNASRQANHQALVKRTGQPLIFVNHTGVQNQGKSIYLFDGGSAIYNRTGEQIASAGQWQDGLFIYEIDLEATGQPVASQTKDNDMASINKALVYGIQRFSAAAKIKKVVLGISGGIDAAVSACLYQQAFGSENIVFLNMPSRFNSNTTKNISAHIAKALKVSYGIMSIEESVNSTCNQLKTTPITNADGSQWNLELSQAVIENIQARDRGSRILAATAATLGGAFSCNTNKTEFCTGYITLYGDLAGYLAAIGDLWKYQVYALANYLNSEIYKKQVIPQACFNIKPSAELSLDQAVEEGKGDPLHYAYHDYLFKSWVEGGESIADTLRHYAAGSLEKHLGCPAGTVNNLFPTPQSFLEDCEHWWRDVNGIAVVKKACSSANH